MESFVVISFIGEGSFGRVFKAKHKETDAIVALKVIRKKGRSSKDLKNLRQECDIQRQLKHPNIILMIDSFDTESELVVVTEYAEKELHSILAKEGCLNEDLVKKVTWDLVSALYYLHSHRVLHRDLKPQNVLMDSTGRAKLCDFGLARIMTNATHILTSIKGTPLYMAPELIEEKPYDHQADLWSLGCIVYELIAGQPPFCTMSIWQLVRMIRHKPVQWPSFISIDARSFLQGLLHKDPAKRLSWPEILEHPFVTGHILILPEDIQSESPFTKPLSYSQQEAKQLQRDKINSNVRTMKMESVKKETREHDLRNVRVMQAMECVPLSDDDSVRATSAFSVRDSLKTDDEDQSQPITAANAKLLRHEYNVMNNSNLVVCNLENNMAQLLAANKKQNDIINKMDKIDEEKQVCDKTVEEVKIVESQQEIADIKQKLKSVDTASHSLENPKSSTKCSSDISSGLSKSVPPSYKQKILQFSRDKLRFGSGGNKLTRSIKRSFHFSRSWDKNKGDSQRRTSEPNVEIPSIVDIDTVSKERCSKEEKDEDIEKCEIIEEFSDDKEIANNDIIVKTEEKHEMKEPSSIELEEWEAFLNSNISEVMDGDVESLTQLNMVSMVIGVVESAARSGRGGPLCGAVAALLALPHTLPRHALLNIQDVYLEAKVVYNFVAAINTLMKDCKNIDDGVEDRLQGVNRMLEVCAWLCVRSCRGVRQFATALKTQNAQAVFTTLLKSYSSSPRIVLNIISLLITVLQDLPEHADVVERILFDDANFNFLYLLEQPSDPLRMRVCILVSLLCTFSCTAFSAAMATKWRKRETDLLEALHTHCNVALNRAARLASKENLPNMMLMEYVCAWVEVLCREINYYPFIITLAFWIIMKKYNYYANLPPGPWGIPFLGYLLFMKKAPHTFYLETAARYGDIFSLQLGNHLVVGIGSAKILKELFSRSDSIARPQTPLNALMEGHGIFLSEGLLWKKQRSFLHDKFRALGVRLSTNQRFEKCILMEVEEMLATLRASTNQPLDPVPVLGRHVHNIICQLMMSFRFVENDAEFELFNERVSRGMELYGAIHIGEYVKQYYYLPGKKAALEEISRNLRDISKFHMDHTTERSEMRANTLESYEPADLLDHYLASLDDETKSGAATNLFHNVDPKKQIVQVMNDLFSAGMETSRSTIAWTLVMMLREPQVAEKVRAELRETLEPDQLVMLEHRCKLPYLEACIYETLRMVSVVPLGTTHCNTTTWTVNNFTIPVGTHIIPLINKINMDPECYPEPGKFIPERFIKCGRLYVPEQFMAFGIGQRMCLGAQLAKMEVFLIFANIMNNFNFILPIGDEFPGLEGTLGVTHAPLPFRLCFAETASF